ncbi:MAG TPA: hypothetical protein VLY45_00025 [Nitrospiria bacterium]|nr:hypothetical protein [Nitrospiria bacterium]
MDKDAYLSLDWTVQAGVRWIFQTPLISEKIITNAVWRFNPVKLIHGM